MDDGIGVGICGIDAERLRQPCAIAGLDRGEAKPAGLVARRDEADPARAEYADAVIEDHVVVGPVVCSARRHLFRSGFDAGSFSARSSSGPAISTPARVSASQWPSRPDAAST